jgi:hypothetical protein
VNHLTVTVLACEEIFVKNVFSTDLEIFSPVVFALSLSGA